jgi:polyisoprenoid-binding protein YceI
MNAKNCLLFIFLALMFVGSAQGQRFLTKTGYIHFFSDAPLEKIQATNRQVNAAVDAGTGDIAFRVLMKSFQFEKALMQEHFNENYVESDKYPNSTFIGKVTNIRDVNFSKAGNYSVNVEGKLTIHGITKDIKETGTFEVKDGKVQAGCKFTIHIGDYKISIPGIVAGHIAETVEITVDLALDKLEK